MRNRLLVAVIVVALAAPLVAAAANLTPLVVGWEQFFKLQWNAGQRAGRPVVYGHLLNDWGFPAAKVQLLVEGLDGSGAIVGQTVAWLGPTVTPGTRAYFEVPVPWKAPAYRVSVFAFEWVQAGGGSELN